VTRQNLRTQKVGEFTPQPFMALGWEVPDIDTTVEKLSERGIQLERFLGRARTWFMDPDGNTLSLTQPYQQ
jgi:hypothetical protein